MSVLEKVRPAPQQPAATAREPRITDENGRRIRVWELVLRYLLLLGVLALTVGPFLWQLSTSLKGPTEDIFSSPPRFLPSDPTPHNYERVAETIPVWDYALNSLKVALANVVTNCVGAALAGYALARLRYRGRRVATLVFILTMLVPVEGIIIAQFTTMRELGLNNTLIGVLLPGCVSALNVLLMRNAFLNLPYEIEEAAYVDGANVWQRFLRIALPAVKGTLAVVAIFAFMGAWDDFLWPLIVLSRRELYTLQVGLNTYAGELNVQWQYILAMTVVTMIPVVLVFVFLQRFITTGIAGQGIK